jgi:dihydroorotate dehydrogenase
VVTALRAFVEHNVIPAWFTLNLSCPNTEDDPRGHQTAEQARMVCGAAVEIANRAGVPLGVKVGPALAGDQYRVLMQVFAEVGVSAAVATNTLSQPTPDDAAVTAGVAGGRLHALALEAARLLVEEKTAHGYPVDVIGCGGVQDGATYREYTRLGIRAVQYWTALIYRGPLAAALIAHEAEV